MGTGWTTVGRRCVTEPIADLLPRPRPGRRSSCVVDLWRASEAEASALAGRHEVCLVLDDVPTGSLQALLQLHEVVLVTSWADSLADLEVAIGAMGPGRCPTTPAAGRLLVEHLRHEPARRSSPVSLSPREAAVAAALRAGLTQSETAQSLGVHPKTVEAHRRSLYAKLGVPNRHEASERRVADPSLLPPRPGEDSTR